MTCRRASRGAWSAHGEILSKRYSEQRVTVHCRIPEKYLGRIQGDGIVVRGHGAGSGTKPAEYEAEEAAAIEEVA